MSGIEITTITNWGLKSEKDMPEFLVEKFGIIKNSIFFMVKYIFKSKSSTKRSESCLKWYARLSASIGVFS
jgi:hypothetical protein